MTILPKKKVQNKDHIVHKSDSDSDSECCCAKCRSGNPHPSSRPEERPAGQHHRRRPEEFAAYESGASCSSSEVQPRGKRQHGASPAPKLASEGSPQWRWELESSGTRQSGYNSSEEYESGHSFDHDREQLFEQRLKKDCGYTVKKMKKDGACLFRAVADQVYGDQDWHSVIRNQSLDYMIKNAEYFTQFITEDFDAYINRKRSDSCHGNHLEMQAMAELYNRTIEVYQYSVEPINLFHGIYKTDNAPIRLSYHQNNHYNSVVDPSAATIGVGLGLAGHKPGLADKLYLEGPMRESDTFDIEKAMLEDKLKSTEWDATCNSIEEAVARESYLLWLKDQEERHQREIGECSSDSKRSIPSSAAGLYSASHKTAQQHKEKLTTSQLLIPGNNFPPVDLNKKPTTAKLASCISKPSSHNSGPYDSSSSKPKSKNGEDEDSSRLRPTSKRSDHLKSSSWSGRTNTFTGSDVNVVSAPQRCCKSSEQVTEERLVLQGGRSSGKTSPVMYTRGGSLPSQRHSPYGQPLNSGHHSGSSSPRDKGSSHDPLDSPTAKQLLAAALALSPKTSPQHSNTTSAHYSPAGSQPGSPANAYHEENVLTMYPFEYSSFQDLPPTAFGLSEWEDDRLLAAVLAASQEEYIKSLKQQGPVKD